MQIAAAMGAEVTGNCSPRNADMVAALGAGRVIDHTQQEFTRQAERHGVIYDTIGVSAFPRPGGA
ncbi:hypothetical protein [Rhodobacter sp. NTK016B]|uniref:hypothetical protein n=1 Tax=Rhodobacter sp. NTK016B TaxID=2759676 RepID=UPI002570B724|nr:hypothetical protein [Rhodobacter sp. NTK016B]